MLDLWYALRYGPRAEEGAAWAWRAVEAGSADAMRRLGAWIGRDDPAAQERLYLRAAEAGDPAAMLDLWLVLRHGPRAEEGDAWAWRAVEAGSTDAMRRLGAWIGRDDPAEGERLYLRAAEAGDSTAFSILADTYYEQGRLAEAETWLRRAAEGGHDWSLSSKLLLLLAKRGADDDVWEVCMRSDDPGGELWHLATTLSGEGMQEVADHWMREAFDLGSVLATVHYAELRERAGDLAEAERLYREARSPRSIAEFFERQGRVAEARSAVEGLNESEWIASLLDRLGETSEATAMRRRVLQERASARAEEWVTVVATVVTTAALVPFVEGLIGRAAEDTYDGIRNKLRKLAHKLARGNEPAESTLIVVSDPDSRLRLHMRTDATDEALAALREADLDARRGALRWHPETRRWEHR
ncbi:SEL1-like repeat protein [Streptosporangium soli]|nr:hypothetical protein [Streptosporangium sp. KLBMP 9127]